MPGPVPNAPVPSEIAQLPTPSTPPPGASSQPQKPGEGGTLGFPGALSSWKILSAFNNGDIVRANFPMMGLDRDERWWRVPRNAKGEVLSSDENTTIVIFPLDTGKLEPHLVRVETDTANLTSSGGSPFIRRKR